MFGNNTDNSGCRKSYDRLVEDDNICIKESCRRKECKEEKCIRHPNNQGENSP